MRRFRCDKKLKSCSFDTPKRCKWLMKGVRVGERMEERESKEKQERNLHANAPSVKEKLFNEFFLLVAATTTLVMSLQHGHKPLVLLLFAF